MFALFVRRNIELTSGEDMRQNRGFVALGNQNVKNRGLKDLFEFVR